ncbi:uncharacterized protein LOC134542096 isoform X2 [Bacillus rossius redtenbacheri]|uniref:uncharacterized protein LOC134542096 isoform X2 n=1 Tax=Bacillus rossius redtenbacheri TaxID=93214 RepID=UPI002FDDB592
MIMSLKPHYNDKSSSNMFDVNNKYLHKKFKKMAETVPVTEKCSTQDETETTRETIVSIGKKVASSVSINGQSIIGAVPSDLEVAHNCNRTLTSNEETELTDDAASQDRNVFVQCKFGCTKNSGPGKCMHYYSDKLGEARIYTLANQKVGNDGDSSSMNPFNCKNKASNRDDAHSSVDYSSQQDGFREVETNNNQDCSKQIYKPKFKAALHYEEGETENKHETKSPSSQLSNHTAVTSPASSLDSVAVLSHRSPSSASSEHSSYQLAKPDNGEVNVDANYPDSVYRSNQRDPSLCRQSPFISIPPHFMKPHFPPGASMLLPTTDDHSRHQLLLSARQPSDTKLLLPFRHLEGDSACLHGNQPLNLCAPGSVYSKIETASSGSDAYNRKRCLTQEHQGASNYKCKKMVLQGNASLASIEKVEKGQLHNGESSKLLGGPERFTIKDLLLKTGGRIQAVEVMQGTLKEVALSEVNADAGEGFIADFNAMSPNKSSCYTCAFCKSGFETAAALIVHQQLYCRQKHQLYSSDLHHVLDKDSKRPFNSSDRISVSLSKETRPLTMQVGNTRATSPSLSSPGPVLGNTLLVAKDVRHTQSSLDEHTMSLSKRRRLDPDLRNSQGARSMGPMLTVTDISGSMSSVRKMDESLMAATHHDSHHSFGEVQILDGAGRTMSLLGNTSRPLGSVADVFLRLPSHMRPHSFPIPGSMPATAVEEDIPRCVIVNSESHSAGAVVHIAQDSSNTSANLSPGSVIKCLHVSGGSVTIDARQRSKSSSPVRKSSLNVSGGGISNTPPPPFSFPSEIHVSPNTASTTNSHSHVAKHLMPVLSNISLPNLSTAKIPVHTLGHHLPFMPYFLGLPDCTVVSSVNLAASVSSQTTPQAASSHRMSGAFTSPDSSGALTIVHQGKNIPYVPGMPGPQTLLVSTPEKMSGRDERFSEPLDLAFSPKEGSLPSFLVKRGQIEDVSISKSTPKTEDSSTAHRTERHTDNGGSSESKRYVTIERKAAVLHSPERPQAKPLAAVEPRIVQITTTKADGKHHAATSLPMQGTSVIRGSDGSRPGVYEPTSGHRGSRSGNLPKQSSHGDKKEDCSGGQEAAKEEKAREGKFHRPTSLPLKPEAFVPRRQFQLGSTPNGSVVLQASPETPRSRKSFGQLHLQGNVFTFLNLKISTRPFFCILTRTQPMYVMQTPDNPKLSMYSNWQIKKTACPNPLGLSTGEALSLYDSRNRDGTYTTARPYDKEAMVYTHSSYWLSRADKGGAARPDWEKSAGASKRREEHSKTAESEASSGEPPPRKAKIFGRGFESRDDYTYVKGRGRGRYVCNDCGIRCLKPSMLRNHIRTHTNIRPYVCRHCNFSFKTKGNLTKHMKSKAHYKKCVKLSIFPVPTVVDDSYIDEECFAQQAAQQGESGDTDSEENDEDEDEDEDDKESEVSNDYLEHEAAHSLLSLSEPVLPGCTMSSSGLAPASSHAGRPSTYPYTLSEWKPAAGSSTPSAGLTPVCAQTERETVLRNTSLAGELGCWRGDGRKDDRGEMSTMVYRRDDAAPFTHIPRQQSDVSKHHRAPGWHVAPHDDKGSTDGRSTADKGSDADDEYGSSVSCSEDDSETSVHKDQQNYNLDVNPNAATLQPIDLSTKNLASVLPYARKKSSMSFSTTKTSPFCSRPQPAAGTKTFALFPGPATAAVSPGQTFDSQAHASADPAETNILHKYLTKREIEHSKLHGQDESLLVEISGAAMTPAESLHHEHAPRESDSGHQLRPQSLPENVIGDVSADKYARLGRIHTIQESARAGVSALAEAARCSDGSDVSSADRAGVGASDAVPEVPSSSDSAAKNAMISRLGFSGQSWVPATSNAADPEARAEFLPPSTRPLPAYVRVMEDGQSMCVLCNKVFSKPSQLRLHVNIHCLEHPFKCELCAVSFRKKGHLKKHEASASHQNRVGSTAAVRTLATANPRPFRCDDCDIAFRIHGHLAKHLRSKMHIMKLECVGKLPFGTYEEMEREGFDPYDIDTTDCENSLESLQGLAQRLHEKDPSKLGHWGGGDGDSFHPHCPSPARQDHTAPRELPVPPSAECRVQRM